MKTKLFLAGISALALVTTAHAEKFLVDFNATEYTSDAAGKIISEPDTTAGEILDVAEAQNPVPDVKTLRYVFDTVKKELQVVRRADGVVLGVRYELRGGVHYVAPNGKTGFRQDYLYAPGGKKPIGSISGFVRIVKDAKGTLTGYYWNADFQVAEKAGTDSAGPFPAEMVTGTISLGKLFVPGS